MRKYQTQMRGRALLVAGEHVKRQDSLRAKRSP